MTTATLMDAVGSALSLSETIKLYQTASRCVFARSRNALILGQFAVTSGTLARSTLSLSVSRCDSSLVRDFGRPDRLSVGVLSLSSQFVRDDGTRLSVVIARVVCRPTNWGRIPPQYDRRYEAVPIRLTSKLILSLITVGLSSLRLEF